MGTLEKLSVAAQLSRMETDETLKLIAAMKVLMLPDEGTDGGLTKCSRERCFKLLVELGQVISKAQGQFNQSQSPDH
jgi:hypothetical protein